MKKLMMSHCVAKHKTEMLPPWLVMLKSFCSNQEEMWGWNFQYGEPSDWEDLAEVKPGVKGDEGAAAVVAVEGDDDDVK